MTRVASTPSIAGHLNVHQDQIDGFGFEHRQRIPAVPGGDHRVPLLFEQVARQPPVHGVIFRQKNPRRPFHRGSHRFGRGSGGDSARETRREVEGTPANLPFRAGGLPGTSPRRFFHSSAPPV